MAHKKIYALIISVCCTFFFRGSPVIIMYTFLFAARLQCLCPDFKPQANFNLMWNFLVNFQSHNLFLKT